jgi:hypothetical protein
MSQMSYDVALARIAQLQSLLAAPAAAAPVATASTTSTSAPATTFSTALQSAGTATLTPATAAQQPASTAGQAIVNLVSKEVGVAEQPPGSNDSPRIAQYRQATAGSGVGPWCAYFTSWAARETGVPLGDNGQGFGRVDDVYAWAQKAGKAIPNTGADVKPQPGDLIVWDEHIGVVESVGTDGTINTIEGNSSDQVSRRSYAPGQRPAIGYVRLG